MLVRCLDVGSECKEDRHRAVVAPTTRTVQGCPSVVITGVNLTRIWNGREHDAMGYRAQG
jgi:hypothetical protein